MMVVYHAEGARACVDNASFWALLLEMAKVAIALESKSRSCSLWFENLHVTDLGIACV